MSSSTLAFALDQNKLPPFEQLALIVVSDSCGDFFTLSEAKSAITRRTSMTGTQAMAMLFSLCECGAIRVKTLNIDPAKESYFVMVQS